MAAISVLVESFEKASVVRGHHIYKAVWMPTLGEELLLEPEDDNEHDKYAVSVVRSSDSCVVGHVPRNDSSILVLPECPYLVLFVQLHVTAFVFSSPALLSLIPTRLFGYSTPESSWCQTPKCLATTSFDVFSAYSTALSFKDTSYALLFDILVTSYSTW